MSKIIVLGGHGKVALLLNRKLSEAGHTVTAVIRSTDQAGDIRQTGAEPLVLNLQESTTAELTDALRGHDAVVWAAGAGGAGREFTFGVDRDAAIRSMDAAQNAGVSRYVMLSFQGSSLEHGFPESHGFYPYAQAKAEADEYLRASRLDWTILGPGYLTNDEPTGTVGFGPIEEFGGDRQGPGPNNERHISRGDVAQTILEALEKPATIHKTIEYGRGDTPIGAALSQ